MSEQDAAPENAVPGMPAHNACPPQEGSDAAGNALPETLSTPAASPLRSPPTREPLPLLILGISLMLCVLAATWFYGRVSRAPRSSTGLITSAHARAATLITGALFYWQLHGDLGEMSTSLAPKLCQLAVATAREWRSVAAITDSPLEDSRRLVNAAALYGVSGDNVHARTAYLAAIRRDPDHRKIYDSLRQLYTPASTPPPLSPAVEQFIAPLSTAPLIRARAAAQLGDHDAEMQALSGYAASGLHLLELCGVLLGGGIVILISALVGWVIFACSPHPAAAPDDTPFPWGLGSALIALSAHFVLSNGMVYFVCRVLLSSPNIETEYAVFMLTTAVSAFIILSIFTAIIGKPFNWRVLGWRPSPRALWSGLLTIVMIYPLIWVASLVSARVFTPEPQPLVPVLLQSHHPMMIAILLVGAVIIAPLVEETFFRGLLFGALRSSMPMWAAATMSGLIFAVFHGQSIVVLPIAIIGIAFAYLTYRTGSLRASACAHGLFNGFTVLTILAFSQAIR